MKNKKSLLSVLLAAVLLCACVAGMLIFGASAEESVYTETYSVTANNGISAAMEQIAQDVADGKITAGPVLIEVQANISETPHDGYLFSKDTIKIGGEALDITIKGAYTVTVEATGTLSTVNDFTFEGITLSTAATKLSLGCRNVVFDSFGISGTSGSIRTILLNDADVTENSSLIVKSGNYNYCGFSLIDGGFEVKENVKTTLVWSATMGSKGLISGCNNAAVYSSDVADNTKEIINGEMEINITGGTAYGTFLLSGNTTVNGVATVKMSGGSMKSSLMGACGTYGGTPVLNGRLNVDVSNVTLAGTFRTAMSNFTANQTSEIYTKIYNCNASNATFLFANGTMKLYGDVEFDIGKFTFTGEAASLVSTNATNNNRKAIQSGNYKFTFREGNKIAGTLYPMRSSKSESYPLVAKCDAEIIFEGGEYTNVYDMKNVDFTGNRKVEVKDGTFKGTVNGSNIEIQGGTFNSTVTGGNITLKGGTFKGNVTGDNVILAGGTIYSGAKENTIVATKATAVTTVMRADGILHKEGQCVLTIPVEYAEKIVVDNSKDIRGYLWYNEEVNDGKVSVISKIPDLNQIVLDVTDRVVIKVLVPKATMEHARDYSGKTFIYYCENLGIDKADAFTIEWDKFPVYNDEYYYFELPAIGAGSFDTELTIFSSVFGAITKQSVTKIAQKGATHYAETDPEAAAVFAALVDYGKAAVEEQFPSQFVPGVTDQALLAYAASLSTNGKKVEGAKEGAAFEFTKMTLLMGDTIGIRLRTDKTDLSAVAGATALYDGEALAASDYRVTTDDEGNVCFDFFVNAKNYETILDLTIQDSNNKQCLLINTSVALVAADLVAVDMAEDGDIDSHRLLATVMLMMAVNSFVA